MSSRILDISFFRNTWEFLIVFLTAVVTVYLPLKFALGEVVTFFTWLEVALTLVFLADLIWLTVQYQNEEAATYHGTVPGRPFYLQPWFILNLLAAIPFVFFAPFGFWAFRLFKLARASKILENWRLLNLQFSNRLALLYLVIVIFIIIHWISCGWMVSWNCRETLNSFSSTSPSAICDSGRVKYGSQTVRTAASSSSRRSVAGIQPASMCSSAMRR